MSESTRSFKRTALALGLLALATQFLAIGLEKLLLLPDIPVLVAYERARHLGETEALTAVQRASGQPISDITIALYKHPALGSFTALMLGCLTAAGLTWWRKAPWWLPLLVLPASLALTWGGLRSILKQGVLSLANYQDNALSLASKFWLIGTLSISCFILLALVAARVLPTYSRAQAASAPGPRSSE